MMSCHVYHQLITCLLNLVSIASCYLQPTILSHRRNSPELLLLTKHRPGKISQLLTSLEPKIPNEKIFNSLELIYSQTSFRKMEHLNEPIWMVQSQKKKKSSENFLYVFAFIKITLECKGPFMPIHCIYLKKILSCPI